jgi:uncharacterized protein YfiM (DUF2279 family)
LKLSVGKLPGRRDANTYFVERPLGKGVGRALRQSGYTVVLHAEVFPDRAEDDVWISAAAANGWVALGSDVRLRFTPGLKRAVFLSGLRLFTLARNHWSGQEKAAAFIAAMPAIQRLLHRLPGPFIATVSKAGAIINVYDFSGFKP